MIISAVRRAGCDIDHGEIARMLPAGDRTHVPRLVGDLVAEGLLVRIDVGRDTYAVPAPPRREGWSK